ncbi:hypothetical protein [Myroides odoratimimus]|uniref:hypothetical protein n=1 Tax=Myroides odoratimimus TaxID=76832 RepID=UPI002575645F|nr:hypothetical protein [Myroides odoratimimus]MDM1465165.1 hypothetical protein [Myroides odoratimimus]MDM1475152.1 hypothetical protein [Myroides odoratimimus]
MRISEIFNLNLTQAQLDFVDIDVLMDTPLFIDPFLLSKRTDNWSYEANRTIQNFFQKVIELIKNDELVKARELFDHFIEPNETCLGTSKGNPNGRGMGKSYADEVFEQLSKSKAVKTGLIQDIEDNVIFIDGFGRDRLSDMATVILKKQLIEYTKNKCNYHGIKLVPNQLTGYYWDSKSQQWDQDMTDLLIINHRHIILVPKGIVSFSKVYTPERFFQHYVLNFYQHEYIRLNSSLIQRRVNGDPYVTKKSLRESLNYSKDFLRNFAEKYPLIFKNFKQKEKVESLRNSNFLEFSVKDITRELISVLESIPSGKDHADQYHKHIKGVIEFLFYPFLTTPVLEKEIHQGRKRIDITFDNAATSGILLNISNQYQLPCPYIMVECKNYTADPTNPELDQLSGRFSYNRGKVGFLLCRSFKNFDLFIKRCQDTYNDQRGLIIPIVDNDLIELLNHYDENNFSYLDKFLRDRIREIALN